MELPTIGTMVKTIIKTLFLFFIIAGAFVQANPIFFGQQSNSFYTLFQQAVPSSIDFGDASAYELGVKFTSDINGKVTGIRFYKSTSNTGTHIGRIWSVGSPGLQLASVTFTGESASGWQEMTFSSPLSIVSGTTYIASFSCPNGHYSANVGYFASAHDSPPLHALANSSDNGVFDTNPGTYPGTNSSTSANFWVDLIFITP